MSSDVCRYLIILHLPSLPSCNETMLLRFEVIFWEESLPDVGDLIYLKAINHA